MEIILPLVCKLCPKFWTLQHALIAGRRVLTHMIRSVQTFQDQGVAKAGAIKSNYAILYSGRVPSPGRGEEPGRREEGMRDPIEVTLESRVNGINPMSRIHLRALHCCQQNWRIFPIGWIAEDSWETLWNNHFLVTDDGYTDGIPPLGGDQEQTRRPRRGRRSNPNASSQ